MRAKVITAWLNGTCSHIYRRPPYLNVEVSYKIVGARHASPGFTRRSLFGMNGGFMMERFKKPRRRKLRLPKYDYTQAGAYYVTICSYKKRCIFGEVVDRQMILNRYGKIVQTAWMKIDHHFPNVKTDQFVVMPNHIHGIFVLNPDPIAGRPRRPSLGMVVGSFKSVTAKNINDLRGTVGADVWQRNYYEHIIRNEQSLEEIREYIANNPRNWERDPENPA